MLFYKDSVSGKEISWSTFLEDLNSISKYNKYCYTNDFYEIIKTITVSLLSGNEIVLLDYDFTDEELLKLTGKEVESITNSDSYINVYLNIKSKEEFDDAINRSDNDWSITLYTSGTTGLPKKVTHSIKSIARFVKKSDDKKNNVWGLAYNPTHMAGIQVIMQALLNGNTIVRLFGSDKENIISDINEHNITNISATPTFYRLLLPINKELKTVKNITVGGEKSGDKLYELIDKSFPNSKITNVYASTEAGAVIATKGDIFTIKEEFRNLIKIKDSTLFIHKTLLGTFDAEADEWYDTGDVVENIEGDDSKFRFVSRKNEMINIGGYKVNPNEVEDVIREYSDVNEAKVYAKDNSVLGKILCCEITSSKEIIESEIREFLRDKLQEFKIPRIIRLVDKISVTRTGKIKR